MIRILCAKIRTSGVFVSNIKALFAMNWRLKRLLGGPFRVIVKIWVALFLGHYKLSQNHLVMPYDIVSTA
jgi:hypothetical protein